MRPMDTLPPDTPVLVFSKWMWRSDEEPEDPSPSWRVAYHSSEYGSPGEIWTVTSNPYEDIARDPIGWLPLPDARA